MLISNIHPLNRRAGVVLFLDEKNQKSSQQRGFSAAQAFARHRR
ncbi:hypothetical protein [Mucilaginibacter sp.]|nr:hypothetical protein [Mucilaginibacter sp.]